MGHAPTRRPLPAAPHRAARPPAPGLRFDAMTVLIVSSQHRSPKHLLPGAPPLSSHRLHTPAAHHRTSPQPARPQSSHRLSALSNSQANHPPATPLPSQIPIAGQLPTSFPRVPSSEAFGRRPPPGRPLTPGRHPKPFTIADLPALARERGGSTPNRTFDPPRL